ncbi:hypothetical protein GGR53DRAFT_209201 [Hypoxylon sp. FL1150]|nr:hypothetical protein GGR53DRAFT_209201 [Hypoxylon sp. FL1150]
MVHRRVIADSDDEDGDDNPPSPEREDIMDPPEVEPLSPHRKQSSSGASGAHIQPPPDSNSTDQSFFASVYDEQQSRAAAQSQLIEHIIRQSQKASGSSGEISLPAKGKGRKANASSSTSVTSPAVLSRPGNQPSLFSDGASNITTPRKSAPGAWDVPSSPDGAKSSKGKNIKSYGKQRRGSKVLSSPAADMFMRDDEPSGEIVPDTNTHNEMSAPSNPAGQSPQPAAKKRRVLLHDSLPQETGAVANFYIAQSNLTTMQKLEYQKVNVPRNSHPGLPGSLDNQKSSGMSTIAYPTPSRYASSSGPPLPWERSPLPDLLPENSTVIDITSSPDIIGAGHDHTEEEMVDKMHEEPLEGSNETNELDKDSPLKESSKKKGTKRPKNTQDEDELGQDEPWDSEIRKDHKRRRSKQMIDSPDPQEGDEEVELITNPHDEPPMDEVHETDVLTFDIPGTEPPPPAPAPEPGIPEVEPTPQPKKRGRKKKQPVSGDVVVQEQTSTVQDPETQPEPDKPKKKRGRPRKSDTEKPEAAAAPEPESISTLKPHEDNIQYDELALEKIPTNKGKSKAKKTKKQPPVHEEADETTNDQAADEDENVTPLREISRNSRTPSQKSAPTDEAPEGADSDQNLPPNQPAAKAATTPKPTPTPTPSQPKVPYRIGLSKRSRITSLLKSIKR